MSYEKLLDKIYEGYREFPGEVLVQQVGRNMMAISGGQWSQPNKYEVEMHAGRDFYVKVRLGFMDTWEVDRVQRIEGRDFVRETWKDVYAWEVGEACYQASCYLQGKEHFAPLR